MVLSLVFVFGMKTKGSLCYISLLDDRSDSLLLRDLRKFLKIVFRWLEFLLMHTECLSGFLYGSQVLLHKSKAMPKKFAKCKLAQTLNTFINFFFILSVSGPEEAFQYC